MAANLWAWEAASGSADPRAIAIAIAHEHDNFLDASFYLHKGSFVGAKKAKDFWGPLPWTHLCVCVNVSFILAFYI